MMTSRCKICNTTVDMHVNGLCPVNGGDSAEKHLYRTRTKALIGSISLLFWLFRHYVRRWQTPLTYIIIGVYIVLCVYVYVKLVESVIHG